MTGYEHVKHLTHRHRDRSYSQAARLGWWEHSHLDGSLPHDHDPITGKRVIYAGDDGNGPPTVAEERAGAEVAELLRARCGGCGESLTSPEAVMDHECECLPGALSFILIGAGWFRWMAERRVRALIRRMTSHHDMPV